MHARPRRAGPARDRQGRRLPGHDRDPRGLIDPVAAGAEVRLSVKRDRVNHWLSMGAQPSDRVAQLLKEQPLLLEQAQGAAA